MKKSTQNVRSNLHKAQEMVKGRRRWRALAFALAVPLCAASGLAASAYNRSLPSPLSVTTPSSTAAPMKAVSASQGNSSAQRLEAETIAIRPWGFEPEEIIRPRGKFILRVDNRSGLDEVDLQITREIGGPLHAARVPRGKLDWRELIDPPPGTYVLRETGHPAWSCRIIVTPR